MRRSFLAFLAVGALLLAALPAAAQPGREDGAEEPRERGRPAESPAQGGQGQGQGGGNANGRPSETPPQDADAGEEGRGNGNAGANGRGNGAGNARGDEKASEEGPAVGSASMTPGSEPDSGSVQGENVAFTFNGTAIQNFTANGVPLFNLTVGPNEGPGRGNARRESKVEGAEVALRTPAFELKAHDNRPAVLTLRTVGPITVAFGPAFLAGAVDARSVEFSVGNVSGTIQGKGIRVEGQSVFTEETVTVRLHPLGGAFQENHRAIGLAIGKGHVGAEAVITRAPGGEDVAQDTVSYGNVTMTTLRAERGNLTVAIEGHGTEGRVVVLNVDGRVVGAQKREDLHVLLDNLTIPQASNLSDVLDPDNDGYQPEHYVVFDPATESFQLLVSVPHYSVHILSVNTIFPIPPPSVVVGVLGGVALLVPGAYALFRRREE